MYGRVLITETVKDEFGEDVPEFNEIRSLKNPSTFLAHRQFIDPGEASTISLGIIMKAKERGFVTSVRGYLEDLQKNGMWISEELIHELLDLSGEVKGA